jgi:hypothetical protein
VNALDECKDVLERIAQVKIPQIKGLQTGNEKIEQLEFYLLQTAELRQEAIYAKLMVQQAVDVLEDEWVALEGWEIFLPNGSRRTAADVREAKRQMKPDLYGSIQTGKRLVDRLTEQVRRLEKDDQVCSRAYTFLTGS